MSRPSGSSQDTRPGVPSGAGVMRPEGGLPLAVSSARLSRCFIPRSVRADIRRMAEISIPASKHESSHSATASLWFSCEPGISRLAASASSSLVCCRVNWSLPWISFWEKPRRRRSQHCSSIAVSSGSGTSSEGLAFRRLSAVSGHRGAMMSLLGG